MLSSLLLRLLKRREQCGGTSHLKMLRIRTSYTFFLHSSESPPFRILCTAKKPATLIGSRHVVMLLIFFEDQGRIMSAESERVAEDNI